MLRQSKIPDLVSWTKDISGQPDRRLSYSKTRCLPVDAGSNNQGTALKRYTISSVRKFILADSDTDLPVRHAALVIIECIDWKTNAKKFFGKPHVKNWLNHCAGSFGVEPDMMPKAIDYLTSVGWLELVAEGAGVALRTTPIPTVA